MFRRDWREPCRSCSWQIDAFEKCFQTHQWSTSTCDRCDPSATAAATAEVSKFACPLPLFMFRWPSGRRNGSGEGWLPLVLHWSWNRSMSSSKIESKWIWFDNPKGPQCDWFLFHLSITGDGNMSYRRCFVCVCCTIRLTSNRQGSHGISHRFQCLMMSIPKITVLHANSIWNYIILWSHMKALTPDSL